mmetsp:Transcript_163/g.599  ORF Transcript_163/g.599 Transcript_163/m.599 type:complete len:256 (+) Transcript_163:288-1055(+)
MRSRWAFLLLAVTGARGGAPGRAKRKADEQRERYASKDPEERKAHRLEKYDRLLEMAEKANVDMPSLRSEVEALKAREEAIIDRDTELRPPKPPRLGTEEEEFGEADSPFNSAMEDFLGGEYRKEGEPIDPAKREEMMQKSKERLERMRDMTPEERIEEMVKERDARLAERVAKDGDNPPEKSFKTKGVGRSSGLENLSPDERHEKLKEHQKKNGRPPTEDERLARPARRLHRRTPRHHGRLPRPLTANPRVRLR